MKKRKVMLDKVLVGVKLEGTLDDLVSEASIVRRVMLNGGAEELGSELSVPIRGRSSAMYLIMRRHKMHNLYYLNLSGNPLTYRKPNNNYGYVEVTEQIVSVYLECLASVGVFPRRVLQAVTDLDININSLEFATYTIPVADKAAVMNAWYYVYSTAYSSVDGRRHETLADLMNLKLQREHKDHKTSVCLRVLSGNGKEVEAMLMAYDKAVEIRDRKGRVPPDIENRIRIELSLNYGWFRRRSIDGDPVKTLRDLEAYVGKRYGGQWALFLAHQFQWALARSCLFHMWEFDPSPVLSRKYTAELGYLDLPYEAYVAMLAARATIHVTDESRRLLLLRRPAAFMKQLSTVACPVVLSLDMGTK